MFKFQSGGHIDRNLSFSENANKINLISYIEEIIDNQKGHGGKSYLTYVHMMNWLKEYGATDDMTLAQVSPQWIRGFAKFLDQAKKQRGPGQLAQNTKATCFSRLRAVINKAFNERLIQDNPLRGIPGFKFVESKRTYLTIEEIRVLASTECRHEDVKRAFLFSCLTGLRWSDISNLKWDEVERQGKYTRLIFRQKKTGRQEYLDISEHAAILLGERKKSGFVFDTLSEYVSNVSIMLRKWVESAGINKHISFHCGRHTFAVMMLDLGTDIYTVSKLLGHRELATTQIYAKILDKNKQAAVDRIPAIFPTT